MTVRVCPACSRRAAQLVAPDCPVCAGAGLLALGRPALARYPEEVVSTAVELALEGQARRDLAPKHPNLTAARANLATEVGRLRSVGLLAKVPTPPAAPRPADMPLEGGQAQAVKLTPGYRPGDARVLRQYPVEYEPDDRPMADGGLPGFSSAGFLCSLSRVADPLDPLTATTRGVAQKRVVTGRAARGLVEATHPRLFG